MPIEVRAKNGRLGRPGRLGPCRENEKAALDRGCDGRNDVHGLEWLS